MYRFLFALGLVVWVAGCSGGDSGSKPSKEASPSNTQNTTPGEDVPTLLPILE